MNSAWKTLIGMLVLLIVLGSPAVVPAARGWTLAGVTLPDTVEQGDKSLVLNGLGLREATFLKVDVYVMGLYLEQKSSDPLAIARSEGDKRIVMHFVRAVGADDISTAWQEGFEKNYPEHGKVREQLDQLKGAMVDMTVGQAIELDFIGDHVEVKAAGGEPRTISGRGFQEGLLLVWLGPEPPNEGLKEGVLGR